MTTTVEEEMRGGNEQRWRDIKGMSVIIDQPGDMHYDLSFIPGE